MSATVPLFHSAPIRIVKSPILDPTTTPLPLYDDSDSTSTISTPEPRGRSLARTPLRSSYVAPPRSPSPYPRTESPEPTGIDALEQPSPPLRNFKAPHPSTLPIPKMFLSGKLGSPPAGEASASKVGKGKERAVEIEEVVDESFGGAGSSAAVMEEEKKRIRRENVAMLVNSMKRRVEALKRGERGGGEGSGASASPILTPEASAEEEGEGEGEGKGSGASTVPNLPSETSGEDEDEPEAENNPEIWAYSIPYIYYGDYLAPGWDHQEPDYSGPGSDEETYSPENYRYQPQAPLFPTLPSWLSVGPGNYPTPAPGVDSNSVALINNGSLRLDDILPRRAAARGRTRV